ACDSSSGRRTAAAGRGEVAKSSISLLRKPISGTYSPQPKRPLRVVVRATALPSPSTVERWVVSPASRAAAPAAAAAAAAADQGARVADGVARARSIPAARDAIQRGSSSWAGVARLGARA